MRDALIYCHFPTLTWFGLWERESCGTEACGTWRTEIWQFLNWVSKGAWRARHRPSQSKRRKRAINQAQGSHHTTTRHQLPHKDHITIHTLLPVRWSWSRPNSLDTHTQNHPLSYQPLTLSPFYSESFLDFKICDKLRGNMSLRGHFEILVILESI